MKLKKDQNPRYDKLLEMYLERQRAVPDAVDAYMLELLTRLKEIYDINQKDLVNAMDKEQRKKYEKREQMLNNIGTCIRRGLSIHLTDPNPTEKGINGRPYNMVHPKWQSGQKTNNKN